MDTQYGLIFDVDGVVADTEPLNARVTIRILDEMFGIAGARPEDFADGFGRGAEEYVKAGAKTYGVELTDEQAHEATGLREQRLIESLRREPLPAFPGVLELMEAGLADQQFRVAIATSATKEMSRAILESAGVPYERMAWVSGSEVSRKKPDPEIFLKAARKLDLPPARCVVFEDTPSGVQAARAAGTRCIAVTNTVEPAELSAADRICKSLEEIDLPTVRSLVDPSS